MKFAVFALFFASAQALRGNQADEELRLLLERDLMASPEPTICYSLNTLVQSQDGLKEMKDVNVGEQVLTSSGDFETVFSVDHLVEGKEQLMVQLFLDNSEEAALELTPTHMVFGDSEDPTPAGMLKVGDVVQTLSGPKSISKVSSTIGNGYINMLTKSGSIVVGKEGIIGSTFAAHFQAHESISYQNYFHTVAQPMEFLCSKISSSPCELKEGAEVVPVAMAGRMLMGAPLAGYGAATVFNFVVGNAMIIATGLVAAAGFKNKA